MALDFVFFVGDIISRVGLWDGTNIQNVWDKCPKCLSKKTQSVTINIESFDLIRLDLKIC